MAANTFEMTEEDYANAVFEDGGSLVVDLSNVEELKFELIPKGIYDVVVDELTYGKSKSSGAAMFTWVFKIDGGDHADRKLYYYTSFSPKALKGTKTSLVRIDAATFSGQFNPEEVANSGDQLGRRLRIKVSHEERQDNGELQARVQNIMPPASATEGAEGGGAFFAG